MAHRLWLVFGLSCWPLDDDDDDDDDNVDVVDVVVAYTCRQRKQATGRLRVKGSVAHVVWCDAGGMTNRQQPWAHRQGQRETARASKSKQKEVHLNSGQC